MSVVIRPIDDLGTLPDESRGRSVQRSVVATVIALGIVALSLWTDDRVEERLAETEGEWSFSVGDWPEWIPYGFEGSLATLDELPRQVPLRSASWRRRLTRALEAHPWIERVDSIDRYGAEISFEAEFLRPVVAVEGSDGFLLVDSTGRVIDVDRTDELDPTWGIPLYRARRGPLPDVAPGTRLDDLELEECLAIVRSLWDDDVLNRHPGRILVIDPMTRPGVPGLLWRLRLRMGEDLYWGRSPASSQVSLAPVEHKLTGLEQVLRLGDQIRGAGGISLFHDEPMVIGPL